MSTNTKLDPGPTHRTSPSPEAGSSIDNMSFNPKDRTDWVDSTRPNGLREVGKELIQDLQTVLQHPERLTPQLREELSRYLYGLTGLILTAPLSIPSREGAYTSIEAARELLNIGAKFAKPGTSAAPAETMQNWRVLQEAANKAELFAADMAQWASEGARKFDEQRAEWLARELPPPTSFLRPPPPKDK